MKVVTLIARRSDLGRDAFRDYYETKHAPLGTRYFPFEKYVRNHIVEARPTEVGFDCLMECWLDRLKAIESLDGETGAIFAEDEAKFMVNRGIGVDVIETVIAGLPRAVDPRGIRKEVLLVSNAAGRDQAEFLNVATGWGKRIASDAPGSYARIVVDEVVPGQSEVGFPGDAILTGWCRDGSRALFNAKPPSGIQIRAAILCDSHETTPEELKSAFSTRR